MEKEREDYLRVLSKNLRESRRNLGEFPKYLGEISKLLRDYLIEIEDNFRNNRG